MNRGGHFANHTGSFNVDDDKAIRLALGNLIRSLDLEVRVYASAEEFIAFGDAATTSCLICDIRMSGVSGVEMRERLCQQGNAPATIFISAYPTPALQERIFAGGALALLEKPYRTDVIVHWISVALGMPL